MRRKKNISEFTTQWTSYNVNVCVTFVKYTVERDAYPLNVDLQTIKGMAYAWLCLCVQHEVTYFNNVNYNCDCKWSNVKRNNEFQCHSATSVSGWCINRKQKGNKRELTTLYISVIDRSLSLTKPKMFRFTEVMECI